MCDPTRESMERVLLELAQAFGLEDCEFDVQEAIHWFASHYHAGQWSNLYSALSTSQFHPGPLANGPEPETTAELLYAELEERFAP